MAQNQLMLEPGCPGPENCEIGMCGCRWLQTGQPWKTDDLTVEQVRAIAADRYDLVVLKSGTVRLSRVQHVEEPVDGRQFGVTLVSGWTAKGNLDEYAGFMLRWFAFLSAEARK